MFEVCFLYFVYDFIIIIIIICIQQVYYAPVNHARPSPVIHVPNYMDYYLFTDP